METTKFSHSLTVHAPNVHVQAVLHRFEQRCRHIPCVARPLYDLIAACQAEMATQSSRGVPLPMARMTIALGVGESTVSRMVKILVESGLLKVRRASEGQRRSGGVNSYWLLDAGRHAISAFKQGTSSAADVMNDVSKEETQTVVVRSAPMPLEVGHTTPPSPSGCVPSDLRLTAAEAMSLSALLFDDSVSDAVRAATADGSFEHLSRLGLSDVEVALVKKQVHISRAAANSREPLLPSSQPAAAETKAVPVIGGVMTIGDVLSSQWPTLAAKSATAGSVIKEKRWRDIWQQIKEAVGATGRSRAVLAELKWSATLGQLKKLGDHGLLVGLKLIKQGRWTVPYHMPSSAYSDIPDADWLHA